jgi:probable addiction module antidote protein
MSLQTTPFDVVDHLKTNEMILAYLAAAFEDGDATLIRAALNDVIRARGITNVAAETGMPRASIYKALGENGNPTLDTLLALTKALGFRLSVEGSINGT